MSKNIFMLLRLLLLLIPNILASQEHEQGEKHNDNAHGNHEVHKKHVISASINHTLIFSAIKNESSSSNITLPSFGLNYSYFFNKKWGIGLHNDIILEDFVVKKSSNLSRSSETEEENIGVIERGTPVSMAIIAIYKPLPFLGLIAGAGREFSPHEDFTVIRFGVEIPYHLPKNWELFGVVSYDINIDAYTSLTYGIGIGKQF